MPDSGTQVTNVIVVCLGTFGSAVLYELAKRNVRTVGVDRHRPPHAFGSSHGETQISPRAVRVAACLDTVTPDRGFIVDRHPSQDRVTIVSACSGHGFKRSAGIGLAVAEEIAEGACGIDLAPFGLSRFPGHGAST